MVANMVLNLLLIVPLAHAGLALATSLSAFLNAGLLLRGLRKDGVYAFHSGWCVLLLRYACANGVMVAVLYLLMPDPDFWRQADWLARSGWLAILVVAGAGSYFMALAVTGMRPRHLRPVM